MSEELFSVLKALQVPVAVLEPVFNTDKQLNDFKYIFVNEASVKSNGISEGRIVGENLLTLFPSHEKNGILKGLKCVFETGKSLDIELNDFKGGPGNLIQGNFRLTSAKYKNYLIINWIDNSFIEGQAKSIKNLMASNEELEQFAYVASHDLQEPLRMVASFTQLLQKRYADKLDADANEYIHFAVDGAKRMKKLVDDLLIYSRVASKDKEWEKVNIQSLVSNIITDMSMLIEESGIKISYKDLPVVYSDKAMLSRLFTNLISNAVKYRRNENPEVWISAHHRDSKWIFSVKDNGIGIKKEYFEKIFLLFRRLHGKSEYSGTGIGLAICKKIVDKLGGRIWVESEPGKGSTFYFEIPGREREYE
jgi:signal transduction histidine kinase